MDIFTCGVCHSEFHSAHDFYDHKVKFSVAYPCKLCDGVKFHYKADLLSHYEEQHNVTEKVTVADGSDGTTDDSDRTQVNLLVTGTDTAGNIVLDTAILEKLFEISSSEAADDGSGVRNNVHIIVKDEDDETKVTEEDDGVALVYMPSSTVDVHSPEPELDKDDEAEKITFPTEEVLHSKIFVCTLCNHFSYQRRGVYTHLVQVHEKNIDFYSDEADKLIQELGLLPSADEQTDALQNLIHAAAAAERFKTVKQPKIYNADDSSSSSTSKSPPKNNYQDYYCTNCKATFSRYKALKNHVCDESGSSDGSSDILDEQDEDDRWTSNNKLKIVKRKKLSAKSKRTITKMKKMKKWSGKSKSKMNEDVTLADDPSLWDEAMKLEWEKIEMEREVVFSCVDHLYTDLTNEMNDNEMSQSSMGDVDKSSDVNSFKCNVCGKISSTLLDIRSHCLTHTNLKPYRCTKCKYATKVKTLLIKHFKGHSSRTDVATSGRDDANKSEQFKCEMCLDEFDNMIALVIHIRKNHQTSERGYSLLLSMACEKVEDNETETTIFRCFFCYDNFEKEEECLEHVKTLHLRNQAVLNTHRIDSTLKTWKCLLCSHTTNYIRPFLKHMTKHKLIFSCCVCHLKVLSFVQLKRHVEEEHVKCEGELGETKVNELVQRSMSDSWYLPEETTRRLNAIIAKACQKLRDRDDSNIMKLIGVLKYKRLSPEVYQHIKQTVGSIECAFCGRLFFSHAELRRHDGIHAVEKQHKCNKCNYSAATKDNLSRHIAKVHEKKLLSCPSCSYTTLCQTTLWKHKKTHQKKLECTECHKQFDKLKMLRQHMIDCHLDTNIKVVDDSGNVVKKSIANKSFKCPHCSRQFHRSILEFKRHMWIHEGIKPIKCKQCSYRCRTTNHLEVHMRKHSTLKPHQCPHCYKDFKSKGSLQYHMHRFHSEGTKTLFACDKCDYTTAQKGHLKLHLRNHLVIRNFSCNLCFYSSNTLSSLKGHYKKKHKGVEFTAVNDEGNNNVVRVLSQDGETSANDGETSTHREEIRVFKCDTCDYRFTNITDFRRHLKIKHGLVNFKWNEVEVKVMQ